MKEKNSQFEVWFVESTGQGEVNQIKMKGKNEELVKESFYKKNKTQFIISVKKLK